MQIWYMEPYPFGDKRMPHHVFPPKTLSPDQLQQISGVISYKVDLEDTNAMKKRISRLRNERNQVTTDILNLDENVKELESKLDDLYEPVEKDVEQIFLVLDGGLYYDVESEEDVWIRIHMEKGDLIIIPKGRPHRCTTTPKNFVKLQRFGFRSEPNRG
ncbi:hypothetical protein FO519_004332 [Halicephalobus sp. NKZ332]|nr:hypothetical protein FO519_004332 [Halicephalobus sp. NKZ332]